MSNNRYKISEGYIGNSKTLIVEDELYGGMVEIAFQGATLLKFVIPQNNEFFNIIDGFHSPDEMISTHGARCWIMAPFANRIPNGLYTFDGKKYQLKPIPPRKDVIHGFTFKEKFQIKEINLGDEHVEVVFLNEQIRDGRYFGYPFSLDVLIKYRYEKNKLTITVIGENKGDVPLPFAPGWHPYFKTSDSGIEHLILTVDADYLIQTDENLIPLNGKDAYTDVMAFPKLNFRSDRLHQERIINGKILDVCYAGLKSNNNGYLESSIFDPQNNLKISMFQNGGATFVYTGDTLDFGQRKSVALEPMKFLTNAFNRKEFSKDVMVMPGNHSEFEFGVKISA